MIPPQIESRLRAGRFPAATADELPSNPVTYPMNPGTCPGYAIFPIGARFVRDVRRSGIAALLLATAAQAQIAAPAANSAKPDDDTVWLSPFVVTTEHDSGYAATSTLAGTRLNTAIANTPVPLSVMTREFLNDIGAIDANRAIEYALNSANDTTDATGNAQTMNPFNYRVRGFANATVTRNYFSSPFLSDSYNVDSYEVARGPNAVLYGIASPAGVFNSSIKFARPGQDLTALQVRIGSFREYRGTTDIARTLGKNKNLAVRLNLLAHDSRGFYEFERTNRKAATLAVTWRPFASTTVRAEFEHARFFDAKARPFPVLDGFGTWAAAGRVVQANPADRPANTVALSAASGTGIWFFPQSSVGPRPVLFSGNYFRTSTNNPVRGGLGTDIPGIFDTSIVPRTANLLGVNNGNISDQDVAGIFVEQRIGRHFALEAAYSQRNRDYLTRVPEQFNDHELFVAVSANDPVFDPNTGALTGNRPNPDVGKYLTRSTYQEQEAYQRLDDFRLTASYDLDFTRKSGWMKWLGHHQLASLLQHSFSRGDSVQRREVNVAANRQVLDLTNTTNAITRINLIDFRSSDPQLHGIADGRQLPVTGPLLGAPGFGVRSGLANIGWSASKSIVESEVIATQSSFFKDHLWITGGIRHDTVENRAPSVFRDPTSREYLGVTYDAPAAPKLADTTKSFGGILHVTPWLSVFTNQSDNFAVQASSLLFGETGSNAFSGNTKGKGRDFGVRSRLFDGKVNLSLGYYKTMQVGQFYFPPGTYGSIVNVLWQAVGESHPLLTGGELQDLNAQGIEFEVTANPSKNLRLTFNYSRANRYSQDRPYSYIMGYANRYKNVWLSPANATKAPGVTTYGATVQDVWNTLQQSFVADMATNGRMPFGLRPENANAFARYQISSGALKGLAVGSGINWRGPMVLGYANNASDQQIRGYAQVYVNALVSYEHRFFGQYNTSFQLNVDNLLNFDDRYPRRYYWFGDAQGSSRTYQYSYLVRRWSLSSTMKF